MYIPYIDNIMIDICKYCHKKEVFWLFFCRITADMRINALYLGIVHAI